MTVAIPLSEAGLTPANPHLFEAQSGSKSEHLDQPSSGALCLHQERAIIKSLNIFQNPTSCTDINLSKTSKQQIEKQQIEKQQESFENLFSRYYPKVLALFRRRGFDEGECADLAQETFLNVLRNFSSYRGEAPFEHWLFRIASNTAKANLRFHNARCRAAVVVPLEEASAHRKEMTAPEDPLRSIMALERSQQLLTAVDCLPTRMRQCVLLFLRQGLRYAEIGEALQISEQTVKVQLSRAKNALRNYWIKKQRWSKA